MRLARVPDLAGVAAIVLSGIALVYLGAREPLGYDSTWHLFVARQPDWSTFWAELLDNAHPPLFYLALKATALAGHAVLIYRAISIALMLVATVMLWRIARRLMVNPWLPPVAALAFGLSYSAIDVGLELRSYALATGLTLAAFAAYVSLAEAAFAEPCRGARLAFALLSSLAVATHYAVIFVVVAAVASAAVLALADADVRGRLGRGRIRILFANVLTFGPPLAVFAVFYATHARGWATRMNHVPEFMFNPTRENVVSFALRTAQAQVELFVPQAWSAALMGALPVGLVLFALLVWDEYRHPGPRWPVALLPAAMLALTCAIVLLAALMGRYPFGGTLRHQFIAFPFAVMAAVVTLDWIDRRLPRPWLRPVLVGMALAGCVASIVSWTPLRAKVPEPLLAPQMDAFRSSFPKVDAVYVDQFNLIPFFAHHHDWHWTLEHTVEPAGLVQVWKVSRGRDVLRVCRDRDWILDLSRPQLYAALRACLNLTGAPAVVVVRSNQEGFSPAWPVGDTAALATAGADQAGLRVVSLEIAGNDVFAGFARGRADGVRILEATYGKNCGGTTGNATSILDRACNGAASCSYPLHVAVLGDPAAGCAKNFVVRWRCGDHGPPQETTLDGEVGFGRVANLQCR